MSNTDVDISELYFEGSPNKKYVTYNLAKDTFDPTLIGISAARKDFSTASFGGYKETGYLDENEGVFNRLALMINNVKMVVTEKEFEGKLNRSVIVKLDMTNPDHRKVAANVKAVYEHVFRLVADRSSNPHTTLKPSVSTVITNICKKKKINAKEQAELDSEVARVFQMEKIIRDIDFDSNGDPLPTCEPILFLKLISHEKFSTIIKDIAGSSWSPSKLLKKTITGSVRFSLGSISFSGKGVKLNVDATEIVIKGIETTSANDVAIEEMMSDVTDEDKRRFLEQKKALENELADNNEQEDTDGIKDDDQFSDQDLDFE